MVVGRGGYLPRRGVVQCLKVCIEVVQRIWEGGIIVTGRWRLLVVSDGLDALPHVPCVSAVSEVSVDSLGVHTFCLSGQDRTVWTSLLLEQLCYLF